VLFTLAAGQSTVLAEVGGPSPPPTVAETLPDATIALDFGRVPPDQRVLFGDVLRITSGSTAKARVTLSGSGRAAAAVRQVGFWDSKHGMVAHGLILNPGETARMAVELDAGVGLLRGVQSGSLTITATLADGSAQKCEVPITLTIVRANHAPNVHPTPDRLTPPSPTSTPLAFRPGGGLGRMLGASLWRPLLLSVALFH
jgi:hypothetical protein